MSSKAAPTSDIEAGSNSETLENVTWDGPDDPDNPYNWPESRKIAVGIVCSVSQLVTTMSASMIVPALDKILEDLGLGPPTGQIAFSVFFLGLGFAPFVVAPLAELFGRKPVWLAGNIFYVFWNAMCPVRHSPALMIIGRLLSGSGASVGITLTGPVLADMYKAKDRGKAVAIAGLLPYLGPALGPIIGGVASQHLWWPWLFWILSIFDMAGLIIGYFVIHESYAPVLLRRKLEATLDETSKSPNDWKTSLHKTWNMIPSRLGPALRIPIKLLILHPSIQIIAFGTALVFGVYTLVLSTFAQLFQQAYRQSSTTASLHYIAIAMGAFACAQAGGPLMDLIWRRMKARRPDTEPTPEYRVPYMLFGIIPGVAGLFCYAWAAERVTHWVVVDIGAGVFTCGSFMFSQGLLAYLLDEFSNTQSASANAASRVGTYVLGFAFPIFAPELYSSMGYGWGTSLLAILLGVFGALTILVLHLKGEKLRSRGREKVQGTVD
ncbi:unnamed protein product [Clonostachys chloroleuca]|uniref:Major facilitator superfamily (MFS) profile domain-containing protein n=1 Tax=Clonostachys chloroleuca TaxID=1926264 RepID=A0AA35LUV6_9HYPO|nr:unnamed protein product [Clonostachys chloroleuca]